MTEIMESAYEEAIASGLLPGVSLLAGNKYGPYLYTLKLSSYTL